MENIERLLIDLQEKDSSSDPISIVENIEALVFSDAAIADKEYVINLIFKSENPPNLLQYLNSFLRTKDKSIIKAKILSLKFIARYVRLIGVFLDHFAVLLFTTLVDIFRKEDSGEVRAACLLPIKNMLRFCQQVGYSETLGMESQVQDFLRILNPTAIALPYFYQYILDDFKFNKKTCTKTAKCDICKILGLLCCAYPGEPSTLQNVKSIVEQCHWILQQNFNAATASDVDTNMISGALSCIDRLCFSFSKEVFPSQTELQSVFAYILKAISAVKQGDLFKYAMSGKALRLLKHHSGLFRGVIASNASQVYALVYDCYLCDKKTLAKHAEEAVLCVLSEIAASTCTARTSTNESGPSATVISQVDPAKTVIALLNSFVIVVNRGAEGASAKELAFSVKAISTLAPAVAYLEGGGVECILDGQHSVAMSLIRAASVVDKAINFATPDTAGDGTYGVSNNGLLKDMYLFVSVACIVNATKACCQPPEVLTWVLATVQDVIIAYPTLTTKQQQAVQLAICYLSESFAEDNSHWSDFIKSLMPILVMRTASRQDISYPGGKDADAGANPGDIDEGVESEDVVISASKPVFDAYLSLWNEILAPENKIITQMLSNKNVNYAETIGVRLLDAFLSQLLTYIRSLNLSYTMTSTMQDATENAADAAVVAAGGTDVPKTKAEVVPSNPIDQDILINLASFFVIMLPRCFTAQVVKWLPILVSEIISISTRFPLVSSLYRMISSIFKVLVQLESSIERQDEKDPTAIVTGVGGTSLVPAEFDSFLQQLKYDDERNLKKALRFFTTDVKLNKVLSEVTAFIAGVKIAMSSYSDELLSCVLEMLMHAPRVVLSRIDQHAASIIMSLETGQQIELALNTLDSFIHRDEIQRQELVKYLPDFLKLLESYLVVPDNARGDQNNSMRFKSKLATKLSFLNAVQSTGNNAADSLGIQRQVLRLLGRLGGDNQFILQSSNAVVASSLAWTSKEFLAIKLPLPGITSSSSGSGRLTQRLTQSTSALTGGYSSEPVEIKVAFDRLIPRIIDLCAAQSAATDHHAKLAAAESLHSIFVLLIGTAASSPDRLRRSEDKRESELSKVYSKLFPILIEMSVDADMVCRKLFDKLLFQVIHWFSGFNQVYEDESAALIDSLIDGLCNSINSSVRSQCATGLGVMFAWSIKQTTKKEMESNTSPADEVLNKLYVISVHPSERFKIGAAKVFNAIYVAFREETALVQRHALQIVYILMKSIREAGNPSSAMLQESQLALKNYCKIIHRSISAKEDRGQLLSSLAERMFPLSLKDLVDWLWLQSVHANHAFRHCAMQLFSVFCPLLRINTGRSSTALEDYARDFVQQSTGQTLVKFSLSMPVADETAIDVVEIAPDESPIDSMTRMQSLLVALDFISWVVRKGIATPLSLFSFEGNESLSQTSSASSKKRKAGGFDARADLQLNERSSLFDRLKNFIGVFQQRLVSMSADEEMPVSSGDCSTDNNSNAKITSRRQQQRADILLAVVSLLNLSLAKCPDARSKTELCSTWATNGLWTDSFQKLIIQVLFEPHCEASNSLLPMYSESTILRERFPDAVQQLLVNCQCIDANRNFSNLIRNAFYSSCSRIVAGTELSSERVALFCRGCKLILDCAKKSLDNGLDLELPLAKRTLFQLFLRVCRDIVAESDPVEIEIGNRVVKMAVECGLPVMPLVSFSASNASQPSCVIQILLQPDLGRKVLDMFEDDIIVALLGEAGSLLSDHASYLLTETMTMLDAEQNIVKRLLSKSLVKFLALVDEKSVPVEIITAVVNVFVSAGLEKFDSKILMIILDLDSSIPFTQQDRQNRVLHAFIVSRAVLTLQSPVSSTDDIVISLKYLPFILAGCTMSCPRPMNQGYPDNADITARVVVALEELVANKFPLVSSEISSSTAEGKQFVVLLNAYLECFASCGSPCLLSPILPILREGSKHKYFKLISAQLRKLVANVALGEAAPTMYLGSGCKVESAVNQICGACIAHIVDEGQTMEVKRIVMDHICLPVLRKCDANTLAAILTHVGGGILGASSGSTLSVIKVLSDKLTQEYGSMFDVETLDALLFVQASAYAIIEIAYDRCSLPALKGEITAAYSGSATNSGKELTQAICRLAHKLVRSDLPMLVTASVKNRLYSAAFSCLTVIVAKTQTEEKFFNSFIFESKPEAQMWSHVVDITAEYQFQNRKFDTKYYGGSLSSELEQAGSSSSNRNRTSRDESALSRYLKSSIYDSSSITQSTSQTIPVTATQLMDAYGISEEADWAEDRTTKDTSKAGNAAGATFDIGMGTDASSSIQGFDDQIIALEMNDLNQQTSMISVVRAIQRMHSLFADQWDGLAQNRSLPKWLTICRELLCDGIGSGYSMEGSPAFSSTSSASPIGDRKKNIRLFILRLFLNQPVCAIIRPFMPQLLAPVIDCSLQDLVGSQIVEYNYFLRDVVFSFCDTWSNAFPEKQAYMTAGRFISRLLSVANHDSTLIASENLKSISTLLELWTRNCTQAGSYLGASLTDNVEMGAIIRLLRIEAAPTGGAHGKASSRGAESVKKRLYGLELLKTVCESGIDLFKLREPGADIKAITNCIVDCMNYPRKEVMEEASVVAGLVLHLLSIAETSSLGTNSVSYSGFCGELQNILSAKLNVNKGWDAVAACLKGICAGDPKFLSRELFIKTHSWFKKMTPRAKYEYLNALVSLACDYPEDLVHHIQPYVSSSLADITVVAFGRGRSIIRLPMIQINTLKLLRKHWRQLDDIHLVDTIFSDALALNLNPATAIEVRLEAYDLLLELCSEHPLLRLTQPIPLDPESRMQTDNAKDNTSINGRSCKDIKRKLSVILLQGLSDPDSDGIDIDDVDSQSAVANATSATQLSQLTPPRSGANTIEESTPLKRKVIKRKIFDFFNNEYNLHVNLFDRLHCLITELFEPTCADFWLQYSSHLLLTLTCSSRQFRSLLFEKGLSSTTKYAPLNLTATLASKAVDGSLSQVAVPMFSLDRKTNSQLLSQTQQMKLFGTQSVDSTQRPEGQLRGTQELQWTQTQSVNTTSQRVSSNQPSFKKLLPTQSVISCFNGGGTWTMELQSQSATQQSRLASGTGKGEVRNIVMTQQRVPRRFKPSLTGSAATFVNNFNYARYNDELRSSMGRKAPSKKLVVYRSYRDGELPDICISLADVLSPMQALCLRDPIVAAQAMMLLFETAFTNSDIISSASVTPEIMLGSLGEMMKRIVSCGVVNSHLVSVVLSWGIFLTRKCSTLASFQVDPVVVGEMALKSLNLHAGVTLIEEQLLALTRSSASFSANAVDIERELWNQLCKLYNALGEQEIFLGLSVKLNTRTEIRQALDAEFDGDYSTAVKTYSEMSQKVVTRNKLTRQDSESQESWEGTSSFGSKPTSPPSQCEIETWDDRTLECLRQLCDWKGLEESLESLAPTNGISTTAKDTPNWLCIANATDNFQLRERLVSPYLACLVNFDDEQHATKLYEFTNYMLQTNSSDDTNSSLRSWLEGRHASELATTFLRRGEWGRVKAYSDMSYMQFLNDWSGLHPCAMQARKNLLQNLQVVVEIEDVALSRQTLKSDRQPENRQQEMLFRWCASEPSSADPAWVWDRIINHRYCLRNTAVFQGNSGSTTDKLVSVHLADLHRSAALSAIQWGNLNAGKMHLEKSSKMKRLACGRVDTLTFADVLAVCNYNQKSIARKIHLGSSSIAELTDMFKKNLKLLDNKLNQLVNQTSAREMVENVRVSILNSDWLRNFALFSSNPQSSAFCGASIGAILHSAQAKELMEAALVGYRKAALLSDTISTSQDGVEISYLTSIKPDSFGSFAKHCDFMLSLVETICEGNDPSRGKSATKRSRDGGSKTTSIENVDATCIASFTDNTALNDPIAMVQLTVAAYMKGLQYGNAFCRSRLLRILKFAGKYRDVEFEGFHPTNIAKIPAWMLLSYAPQLMSCLDLPEGPTAIQFLESVGKSYPNALQYPLNITSEFLGEQGKQLSAGLQQQLKNPSIDAFIESLFGLTHPELRWTDGLKSLASILSALFPSSSSQSQASKALPQASQKKILDYYSTLKDATLKSSWTRVGNKIGKYNQLWVKKLIKIADDCVGVNGEKLCSVGRQALALLSEKTKPLCGKSTMKFAEGSVPLAEFSEWLAEFDHTAHKIEIPGQYFSDCRGPPDVSQHEIILGVNQSLLVMSSIRKPKRIKFYSSSGKECPFLVKGGEDLRNDERIQKLFMLMNSVIAPKSSDQQSSTRMLPGQFGLRARTYAVIPMNSRVGLLEWVNNTLPLKSVVSSEMARDTAFLAKNQRAAASMTTKGEFDITEINTAHIREKWVGGDYHKMFKSKDKKSACKLFDSLSADLPDYFVRNYLLGLSTGPESFLTLRSEFAKTLAVSSIFGYILGIGDRHLDNLLVDKSNGGIIQIDFGICFGMGASLLPVPELLPFRLTTQLRAALQPLDGTGLLRQYMVYCLQQLRAEDGIEAVSNALEVYLNDPLVEWMKNPLMAREEMLQMNQEGQNITWEPARRINNAVRKIRGSHPVALLLDDLSSNPTVKSQQSFDSLAIIALESAVITSSVEPAVGGDVVPDRSMDIEPSSSMAEIEPSRSKKRSKATASSALSIPDSMPPASLLVAQSASMAGSSIGIDPRTSGQQIVATLNAQPALEAGNQVDILIAMATNPNITMRQWVGLAAWI